MNVDSILLVGSALCFGLAVFNIPSKVNLVALGLLLGVLTLLI